MRTIFLCLSLTMLNVGTSHAFNDPLKDNRQKSISFTENKGQVTDQLGRIRPDVLFSGQTNGMVFHLKEHGISYQLTRVDSWKKSTLSRTKVKALKNLPEVPAQKSIYRIDISWINMNPKPSVQKDAQLPGLNNYYSSRSAPALNVCSYEGITYKSIYNNIDLHYYQKNGALKFDFIVAPQSDYKKIALKIEGAEKIMVQKNGSLLLQTPLGTIEEGAPIVYQKDKVLVSKWVINGNVLSFDVENYNPALPLVIDPTTRLWGTYYGGVDVDVIAHVETDASNNVIVCGMTEGASGSIIATSGSHLSTYAGGGYDGFLAKFNASGVRQWATYYGGAGDEYLNSVSTNASGEIFTVGTSDGLSPTGLSTTGTHQPALGGSYDAFIVKFNSSGVRQWASFYGGANDEEGISCSADGAGNVYLGGYTDSNTGTVIATSTGHQPVFGGFYDGFVAKFSSLGARLWGTYYGDTGYEDIGPIKATAAGDLFISGTTESSTGTSIATSSSYQSAISGLSDAYVAKFNAAGVRQWGSYFGGSNDDFGYALDVDGSGNVIIGGDTESSGLATTGAHQTTNAGQGDAFMAKFNTSGVIQLATYYGGSGYDDTYGVSTDATGNIYLSGTTESTGSNIISTAGGHQTLIGGSSAIDAYLVRFSPTGVRHWGTYYGGSGDDLGYVAADAAGDVYLAGSTDSNTGTVVATASSHQSSYGGGLVDGFLAKFSGCTVPAAPTNTTPLINRSVCLGNTTTLTASGAGNISWFTASTGGTAAATSATYAVSAMPVGTYTYYAEATECATSANRTAITLTVNSLPTVTSSSSKTVACVGEQILLSAAGGATSYSWAGVGAGSTVTVTPPPNVTSYTVTGTDVNGCQGISIITVTVSQCIGLSENRSSIFFNLFPNPTKNTITVESTLEATYSIINALGQLCGTGKISEGNNLLSLPAEAGLYIITINTSRSTHTERVIKE